MSTVVEKLPSRKTRCRWFVKHNARTYRDCRGFRSKAEANDWIAAFGAALDWRVGYRFRLKGDTFDTVIVDRTGQECKA